MIKSPLLNIKLPSNINRHISLGNILFIGGPYNPTTTKLTMEVVKHCNSNHLICLESTWVSGHYLDLTFSFLVVPPSLLVSLELAVIVSPIRWIST